MKVAEGTPGHRRQRDRRGTAVRCEPRHFGIGQGSARLQSRELDRESARMIGNFDDLLENAPQELRIGHQVRVELDRARCAHHRQQRKRLEVVPGILNRALGSPTFRRRGEWLDFSLQHGGARGPRSLLCRALPWCGRPLYRTAAAGKARTATCCFISDIFEIENYQTIFSVAAKPQSVSNMGGEKGRVETDTPTQTTTRLTQAE